MSKIQVTFSDLTHTGQLVAANIFPLGVSLVAAYAKNAFGDLIEANIFKYPEDLSNHLSRSIPQAACFSNFLWNKRLSTAFSERIKQASQETAIIFGGPNYPLTREEQTTFLSENQVIDFYVYRESERSFTGLLKMLMENNFDVPGLKALRKEIPGVHYLSNGLLICGEPLERIQDLSETPSPYLSGMMDKFFDKALIPVIETNRGCPFSCTFCFEGSEFFQKVYWSTRERINAELDYIAERVQGPDILIADSNFGMFQEDIETAQKLAELQKSHDWPKYLLNSSGKNRKDRIMKVAEILNGAMVLTSSIQSVDETVLKNIKRKNISLDQIIEVGKFSERLGANSYSEVILAMPGDDSEAHIRSINFLIEAGINYVMMYQMLMLPGTEAASPESRDRFELETYYRVVPRSFGQYDILGDSVPVAEIEEICAGARDLSFQDYLDCRTYNLTVEIFYNGGVFRELINFLKLNGVKASEFIAKAHERVTGSDNPLSGYYKDFVSENRERLWKDRDSLEDFTHEPDIIKRFISGELGSSEIYKYKTIIFFWRQKPLHRLAFATARELFKGAGGLDEKTRRYLKELDEFCLMRKDALHETDRDVTKMFSFDFIALSKTNFEDNPLDYESTKEVPIRIFHDQEQRSLIEKYRSQYGDNISGLGRLLSRTNVNTLYRKYAYAAKS